MKIIVSNAIGEQRMKHVKAMFDWYNSTDHDFLSAFILGAAGMIAAWVLVM